MSTHAVSVRRIQASDWPDIDRIQLNAYPAFLHESLDVIQQKQRLSPQSCWAAMDTVTDRLLGYLITHRWHDPESPPSLDTELLHATGDWLYVHDLAVDADAQGRGVAKALWQAFTQYSAAEAASGTLLVAVNGSTPFWTKHGFEALTPLPLTKGYGENAVLMQRR